MIYFNCDYNEGAHPRILQRLMRTNMEQTPGYGEDFYCSQASDRIRTLCENPDLDVHFLTGGTQANLTVISVALRPHQAVIAAVTGHINAHETGAIEATGHKVLGLPSEDGKITAAQIEELVKAHYEDSSREHLVQPKLVYLSDSTELGTIYRLEELEAISQVCREHHLFLFLDGARLGYALTAADNDLDLPAIARCCDVFYIGGTKAGALFGEAVVIANPELKVDFRYVMKQKGAMLAKGRLLGIQFLELFQDNLYFEIAAHANEMAQRLRQTLCDNGYPLLLPGTTNQIFCILPDSLLNALQSTYSFCYHMRIDEKHSAVRICTSWATDPANVERLICDIQHLSHPIQE